MKERRKVGAPIIYSVIFILLSVVVFVFFSTKKAFNFDFNSNKKVSADLKNAPPTVTLPNRVNLGESDSGSLNFEIKLQEADQGRAQLSLFKVPAGLELFFADGLKEKVFTRSESAQLFWKNTEGLSLCAHEVEMKMIYGEVEAVIPVPFVKSRKIVRQPNKAAEFTSGDTETFVMLPELRELKGSRFTFLSLIKRVGVQTKDAGIFSFWSEDWNKNFSLNLHPSGEMFIHYNGKLMDIQTNLILPNNQWVKVALSIDTEKVMLYLNNNSFQIHTKDMGKVDFSQPLLLGSHYGAFNRNFSGILDEVSFWEKSLSEVEIFQHQSSYLSGKEQGLLRYYQFNGNVLDQMSCQDGSWESVSSPKYVKEDYSFKLF